LGEKNTVTISSQRRWEKKNTVTISSQRRWEKKNTVTISSQRRWEKKNTVTIPSPGVGKDDIRYSFYLLTYKFKRKWQK
jgi:hypothetical protein